MEEKNESGNSLLSVNLNEEPKVVPEEVEKETKPQAKTVEDALRAYKGSPSEAQLDSWKLDYGQVYCSGFTDTELFVFRPLTRKEWTNLQIAISQAKEPVSQYDVEEKVASVCVLWASPEGAKSLQVKGGSFSTLYEQIMQSSNFMNPMVAASYVSKL